VVALVVPVAAALTDGRCCAWVAAVGFDPFGGSNANDIAEQSDETRDLDAEGAEIQHRMEVKNALIENLVAGRSGLAEVTARFLALDEGRPAYMMALRNAQPGSTDEEKMARNVIGYTHPALNSLSFFQRTAVLSRLEAEFRDYTNGLVSLSDHR
jgi:hypothetical protein